MKKLKMKARPGVTLVELLVVILIVTILSVGLLPLLKPFIEQSKYAAEVQPALANIQTKINLYQYEKDRLPCTKVDDDGQGGKTEDGSVNDITDYGWMLDADKSSEKLRVYKEATITSGSADETDLSTQRHLVKYVDVDWQDLMGKRLNPSQFRYRLIKGFGAAKYGYVLGVFGDGDGLAKGTGYAVLVLVDTKAKVKVLATWERYKPKSDEVVNFAVSSDGEVADNVCGIPMTYNDLNADDIDKDTWSGWLNRLKTLGWSFNFDDVEAN